MKLCWICGSEINESPDEDNPVYHSEVRLVTGSTLTRRIHKSGNVYVCGECTENKIGISKTGENVNDRNTSRN